MLYGEKSREDLNAHAEELFKDIMSRRDRRNLYDDVNNKFNLPYDTIEQMVTFKRDIREFTTFEVFAVVWFADRDSLKKYFTVDEIKYLSEQKVETETIQLPLTFTNMVEIAPDQWIGKITLQQIIKMRNARLINYEEGEQRAFRRMKSGNIEIWRPFVSNRNVKEIKASMEAGTYIPDPITLNMPEGSQYSFENNTLTVFSLPKGMFNLDDGYHRYLAMIMINNFDKTFDYPMELRIVNFSNAKANNFIFQQDQKTPMKKVMSDSYDQNAVANKVIARLKEDPSCNVQTMIGRNDAKINEAVLSKLIKHFFVNQHVKKEDEMAHVISIKNDLRRKFNALTEQDARFFNGYTDALLFVTMYVFASDILEAKYAEKITQLYDSLSDADKKVMNISTIGSVRKRAINILDARR